MSAKKRPFKKPDIYSHPNADIKLNVLRTACPIGHIFRYIYSNLTIQTKHLQEISFEEDNIRHQSSHRGKNQYTYRATNSRDNWR